MMPGSGLFTYRKKNYNSTPKYGAAANQRQIQLLQRRVAALSPEVKTKQFTWTTLSADSTIVYAYLFPLPEGTGEDERIGDSVKIKSISIRADPNFGNDDIDFYIIKNEQPDRIPGYSDFLSVPGGHLKTTIGKEIYHKLFNVGSLDQTLNYKKYFKTPLVVKYGTGGTEAQHNNWYIVIRNSSGASFNVKMSIELKYTD